MTYKECASGHVIDEAVERCSRCNGVAVTSSVEVVPEVEEVVELGGEDIVTPEQEDEINQVDQEEEEVQTLEVSPEEVDEIEVIKVQQREGNDESVDTLDIIEELPKEEDTTSLPISPEEVGINSTKFGSVFE